jgi:hypothetical protein
MGKVCAIKLLRKALFSGITAETQLSNGLTGHTSYIPSTLK